VTELHIVRGGTPTDEELAALVIALAARAATAAAAAEPPSLRQPLTPWVASGLVKGTRTTV
jgi:Acyl-CoA carboxylase epsilon subunit